MLPEGAMREYLAERAGVHAERDFFLLWALGQDLPGAVTVRSMDGNSLPPVSGDGKIDVERDNEKVLHFSLAGVQLKFSAVVEATGGLTIPVKGIGGSWIVKLPSVKFKKLPENEFSMMMLARQVGIDIPEIALHKVEDISGLPEEMKALGGQALAIKRFDRNNNGTRIHIEDFAQVFGVYPNRKYARASYKNIAEVIWAEISEKGVVEFIRRVVFNTLIGNADMHLKNWSLSYPDRKHAVLSPGYDFVSTIQYLPDYKMALNYSRTKRMTELTKDEWLHLAAKAKLPKKLVSDADLETVEKFHSAWGKEKSHLPISKKLIETIDKHAKTIPL